MIIGLMPARNESWVLRYSARAALQWVDHLIILAHACKDDTVAIAEQIQSETGRVTVIVEPNPDWREADNRQRMLETGRRLGGTIFVAIDADEILCADQVPNVRGQLHALRSGQLWALPFVDLWRSLDKYRVDKGSTAPFAFRDQPGMHWRPGDDGYQLHMRNPRPTQWRPVETNPRQGGMMHLQRALWQRSLARQAKYKILEQLYWPARRFGVHQIDARMHRSVDETGLKLEPVPAAWWAHGLDRGLIDLDVEPWEVEEVRALVAAHGREKFQGLNLYGIA
jgi:Glycosyl transferase family 2